MTDEHRQPRRNANERDPLWQALDKLREETSTRRHDQTKQITGVIAEFEVRVDRRLEDVSKGLREVERVIDQSSPSTLGPRVHTVEMWKAVADGPERGGLPKRLEDLEEWRDNMVGIIRAFRVLGVVMTVIAAVATIAAAVATWVALTGP